MPFSFAGLSFSSPLDLILEYPTTKTPLLESLTPTLSPPGVTYISLFFVLLSEIILDFSLNTLKFSFLQREVLLAIHSLDIIILSLETFSTFFKVKRAPSIKVRINIGAVNTVIFFIIFFLILSPPFVSNFKFPTNIFLYAIVSFL